MKDLETEELKQYFKENILYALKKAKNPDIEISFRFNGHHQGSRFTYKENISIFAGTFTYKGVSFHSSKVDKDTILNIIVDNFCYNQFTFIDCIEKFGKVECHGFGDYWGTDKFIFVYQRMNCI